MTEKMTRMTQFVKKKLQMQLHMVSSAILSIPALIILIIHASKHVPHSRSCIYCLWCKYVLTVLVFNIAT